MSAYFCSALTYGRIAAGLELMDTSKCDNYPAHAHNRTDYRLLTTQTVKRQYTGQQGIAGTLQVLNIRALQARYPSGWQAMLPPEAQRYEPSQTPTPIQLYKSLRGYLYQCAEGDVPADPVYQAIQRIADIVAAWVVAHLPEYDDAEWA